MSELPWQMVEERILKVRMWAYYKRYIMWAIKPIRELSQGTQSISTHLPRISKCDGQRGTSTIKELKGGSVLQARDNGEDIISKLGLLTAMGMIQAIK